MEHKPRYKYAVGLEYEEGRPSAPNLSVKGERLSADEIVRIARRYGVPVVEKPVLAQVLTKLEVDDEIPNDLFEAVAAVMAGLEKEG
jgi:flagellar biosynthesis protein